MNRNTFLPLFMVCLIVTGTGFCREGLARSVKHDAGSPTSQLNGSECDVVAHGSFDCTVSVRDADTLINNGPGVGSVVFTGGARESNLSDCNCEAEENVSLGHWSCRCPVSKEGKAKMNYHITCEKVSDGELYEVDAPESRLSVVCK